MQALFRKIAASLPGMESLSQGKPEQLEEVKLTPNTVSLDAKAPEAASTCSC
jgi:Ras-related protein Rab-6A